MHKCYECSKQIKNGCRCEDCSAKNITRTKKWRERNMPHVKDYEKKYREENRDLLNENDRKKYAENPDKYRKKNMDKYYKNHEKYKKDANIRGKEYYKKNKNNPNFKKKLDARRKVRDIKIEGLCEICKKRKAIDRHHPDYSIPTWIICICRPCHKKLHRRIK